MFRNRALNCKVVEALEQLASALSGQLSPEGRARWSESQSHLQEVNPVAEKMRRRVQARSELETVKVQLQELLPGAPSAEAVKAAQELVDKKGEGYEAVEKSQALELEVVATYGVKMAEKAASEAAQRREEEAAAAAAAEEARRPVEALMEENQRRMEAQRAAEEASARAERRRLEEERRAEQEAEANRLASEDALLRMEKVTAIASEPADVWLRLIRIGNEGFQQKLGRQPGVWHLGVSESRRGFSSGALASALWRASDLVAALGLSSSGPTERFLMLAEPDMMSAYEDWNKWHKRLLAISGFLQSLEKSAKELLQSWESSVPD
ncbi:hypothetical protein AK812_SmicGene5234 [Symbiodinium microadriaticum]|uniref:Uncharacterized protein n=1 Tax=Symbiodinium microadriaticum TaxID=2951 RepID=A0A1Q9EU89_SYMMI|nr:hypothetical protein AK812_SmicGene5234 [Symbiodinium microadriaticum]